MLNYQFDKTMEKRLYILKLGGSVITFKKDNLKKIHAKNMERLALEIAEAKKKRIFSLIIVHGVGPFGHVIAKKFNLINGYKNKKQIEAFSNLGLDLLKLNYGVVNFLIKSGINAVPLQPAAGWMLNNGKIQANNLEIIKKMLELKITPVLYGDILMDTKKGFGILSGDRIVSCLAKKFKADRIIMGTDTDGLFDCDPQINKNAKLLKKVTRKNIKNLKIGRSTAIDVTGGMKGKIEELLTLADLGIRSEIINISKAGILKKSLLENKNLGTIIK